jgi:hypothetical protein
VILLKRSTTFTYFVLKFDTRAALVKKVYFLTSVSIAGLPLRSASLLLWTVCILWARCPVGAKNGNI